MWELIDEGTPDLSALAREFFAFPDNISSIDHCQSLPDQNWSKTMSHHLSCVLSNDFALCTLQNFEFCIPCPFPKLVHLWDSSQSYNVNILLHIDHQAGLYWGRPARLPEGRVLPR